MRLSYWVLLTKLWDCKDIHLQLKATNGFDCLIFALFARLCSIYFFTILPWLSYLCHIFCWLDSALSSSRPLSLSLESVNPNPSVVSRSSRGEGDPSIFQVDSPSNWSITFCLHPEYFRLNPECFFLNTRSFWLSSRYIWPHPDFLVYSLWVLLNPEAYWLNPESFWLNLCLSVWILSVLAHSWVLLTASWVFLTKTRVWLAQSWVLLTELCVFLTQSWVFLAQSWVLVAKLCVFLTESWVLSTESWDCKDIHLQPKATNGFDWLIFAFFAWLRSLYFCTILI